MHFFTIETKHNGFANRSFDNTVSHVEKVSLSLTHLSKENSCCAGAVSVPNHGFREIDHLVCNSAKLISLKCVHLNQVMILRNVNKRRCLLD